MLGRGGFAVVWAGVDAELGEVAIKIAHRRDAVSVARFAAEARALAAIGAPAVPRLHAARTTVDGRPALVIERLRGVELSAWLERCDEPPAIAAWLEVACGLGAALAAVHRAGLVHRDLKPENVFVRDDGTVALLDLGLVAGAGTAAVTRTGAAVGTASYSAPEQLRGDPVGPATDVYAFGVILYELCTLEVPFVGEVAEIEHGHLLRRPAPPSARHGAAAALDDVVLACLAKSPADRPATIDEVVARLRRAATDDSVAPRPRRSSQITLRRAGQRPVAVIGLATARIDLVAELARRHGAVVARLGPEHSVLAVLDGDAPLEHAVAIAEAAVPAVTMAVVHLLSAQVRVDAGRVEPRLFSAQLDDVHGWWPPRGAVGALVSPVAAPLVARRTIARSDDGFRALAPRRSVVGEVLGRDAERARLDVAWRAAASGPVLVTVIGAAGLGRSALIDVITAGASDAACAVIYEARHAGTTARDPVRAFAEAVLRAALPTEVEPQRACAQVVGSDGAAVWATLATPAAERRQLDAAHALATVLIAVARLGPTLAIVDDAHLAAIEVLDALELATAARSGPPLLIAALATPRLRELRPRWGTRARHRDELELAPLAPEFAAALLTELLAPASRIPTATVERLVRWADAVPQQLVDLSRALRLVGAIQQHPGSDEWYLAEDRLTELPASASAQWLAARELAALPPDLAELARLCAIVGDEIVPAELAALHEVVELAHALDARAGLAALRSEGLLVVADGGYRFRQAALQEACYALTDARDRAAVHAGAYRLWLTDTGSAPLLRAARLAYHGARSGHLAEARGCHVALATAAARRHAYREAEQHYGQALALCRDDDLHVRLQALAGRGAMRRHLTHYEQARADVVAARAIAEQLDDALAVVELLIAESAVCDFLQRYGEAAELAEAAARRAPAGVPPAVQARLANWLGVARFHQHRDTEAVELLGLAIAMGAALGDHESEIGAALIAGHACVRLGRTRDGLALLDRVIARCREVGDYFHLACAHSNRVVVWRELGKPERATADLEAVIAIARDFGFALLEAAGLANLAEHLCWLGRLDEAVAASADAHQQSVARFREQPLAIVSLYHAQLAALVGRLDEAARVLGELGEIDLAEPSIAIMHDAVTLALAGPDADWTALHARAATLAGGLQPSELLWLEARVAQRHGDRMRALRCLTEAAARAERDGPEMSAAIARERTALSE